MQFLDLSGNSPPAVIGKADEDISAPTSRLRSVTPSDLVDLPDGPAHALRVTVAGDVALIAADDDTSHVLPGVTVGETIPIRTRRVLATGTTATVKAQY